MKTIGNSDKFHILANQFKKKYMSVKPEKYRLYWVSDAIGQDWFVLAPSFKNVAEFYEMELVEEFHSTYESLSFEMYGGGVYADCDAQYVCDVPLSILEDTHMKTFHQSGEEIKGETASYLELSKQSYIDLIEGLDVLEDVLENELLPQFPPHLAKEIRNSDHPSDAAYDYFLENFEDTEGIRVMFEDVYGVEDEDIIDIILFFLFCKRIRSNVDFFGLDKPYGCLYAPQAILEKINGMSLIDKGRTSKHRTYIYDGIVYQEGTDVIRINRRKL